MCYRLLTSKAEERVREEEEESEEREKGAREELEGMYAPFPLY